MYYLCVCRMCLVCTNYLLSRRAVNRVQQSAPNHFHNRSRNRQSTHQSSQSRRRPDYKALGLDGVCLHCGRSNHRSNECKIDRLKLKCSGCGKQGHIEKVCITTLLRQRRDKTPHQSKQQNSSKTSDANAVRIESAHTFETFAIRCVNKKIVDLFDVQVDARKYFIDVTLNGSPVKFEVDSGTAFTLLPVTMFRGMYPNPTLQPSNYIFKAYTNDLFHPYGCTQVSFEHKGIKLSELLYVVPDKYTPLLGRVWIRHMGISLEELDRLAAGANSTPLTVLQVSRNTDELVQRIENKFAQAFQQTVGRAPNRIIRLQLRAEAKPIFVKPRPLPFALQDAVAAELDELEKQQIITKVETSDWGSPLVVVPKPDGKLRLCADYKVTANPQLVDAPYPLPQITEVLHTLRNARYFCTLDLYKAYLHVAVDDDSARIQTISTHKGCYTVNRLRETRASGATGQKEPTLF